MNNKLPARIVVLSSFAFLVLAACSSETSSTTHATLADGCYINTDCNAPLVCAFRRCHAECETTRDCPGGARCVESDRPFHVCQLGVEKNCTYNSDCPQGQVCGVDQNCRDQCKTDSDCVPGQVCTKGTCAEPSELVDGGLLATSSPSSGTDASARTETCQYNSDCPSPMICQNAVCIPECKADVDCIGRGPGFACMNGGCVASSPPDAGVADSSGQDATLQDAGKACTYNSDCTPQICKNGVCIDECRADIDCPAGESCNANHVCVFAGDAAVPPDAPTGYGAGCVYTSDCTFPLVCKPSGSCGYECLTALDCATGDYCNANHQCVFGTPPPADAGAPESGTDAGTGKACTGNLDCSDGIFCNGDEQCILGHCAAAADTPCDTHATCITSTCNEASKSCSYTTLGATDADGDGHLDQACGGDDCNDRDSTVFAGHAELCDEKDNDCNGLVDDYAVVARGAEYTSITGVGTGYCGFGGCSQVMTSTFGTGFLSGRLVSSSGSAFDVQPMSLGGVAGTDTQVAHPSAYITNTRLIGFGGNTLPSPSAVIVYALDVGNNYTGPLAASVVNPVAVDGGGTTFAAATPVTLVGNNVPYAYGGWVAEADVDWTGSAFLVTWSRLNTANNMINGGFTTLNTDGTQAGSATPVPTAAVVDGGTPTGTLGNGGTSPVSLRAAVNGSVFAFVYGQWTSYYTAAVGTAYLTSASGATIAGPIALNGMPLDIAAYGSGFVALTQSPSGLTMTYISSTGTVLSTVSAANLAANGNFVATDARGAPDPDKGVMFAVRFSAGYNTGSQGTMRLVRARLNARGTFDPMEVTTPIQPMASGSNDRIDLTLLADGRLGLSYWEPAADNAVHVRVVSCLP